MRERHNLYLFPGIGADERLFKLLRIENCNTVPVQWEIPHKYESLPSFAARLLKQVDQTRPFSLIGISFGGMVASEIAKISEPEHVVLISSAKSGKELPWYFPVGRSIPIHRWVPAGWMVKFSLLLKYTAVGVRKEDKRFLAGMLREIPAMFIHRAVDCVVNWRAEEYDPKIVHIHGEYDGVIPYRNIENCITIKNGTHFIVLDRADEVNGHLAEVFKDV